MTMKIFCSVLMSYFCQSTWC